MADSAKKQNFYSKISKKIGIDFVFVYTNLFGAINILLNLMQKVEHVLLQVRH